MTNFIRVRVRTLALVVCLLSALAPVLPAWALQVGGLYQATVPVADRSEGARLAAFQQALAQVLVKMTGNAAVAASPSLAPALQQPAQYIQQYAYQQQPGTPASAATSLQLRVDFDPPAIDSLLRAAQLPLWGRERPLVVMWVGVDGDRNDRFIVGSDGDQPHPGARGALQQAADTRGLPVLFPLLDLQDQAAVHFSDLDGGFMDSIVTASARYEANAVVAGVVRPSAGSQWRGQWWLAFRGRTDHWSTQGASRDTVLAAGVDGVADRLAASLAVSGTAQPNQAGDRVDVEISGVGQVAVYARIEHLLGHLAPIASARVVAVAGDTVTFSVVPRGSASDVARNLALVGWLAPETPPVPTPPSTASLPASTTLPASGSLPVSTSLATAPPVPIPVPAQILYFRYQP
ncbi:DUF2066 domain-containing protein [Acidihalobacter yilgarnensis]|uniref:DUF2066 domain-containing protein n=1 Tax=Acidihalobacter yilgarnensis TaxID=2819280 RepID=UPI0018D3C04E|nr:DUF2066 domain-containing protein [Acidihalobacter yilgarnensis]